MTKQVGKIQFDYEREYEWLIFAQSYLQCALISARILNKKLSRFAISEDSPRDYCLKEIYGDYPNSPEYLIFPILFNFKHGIEIYLKVISGVTNSDFPKEHDLLDLLNQTSIKDDEIKRIVRKYAFGKLLLSLNEKSDKSNDFERYPQGSPYDDLEMFPAAGKSGEIISVPKMTNFEDFVRWVVQNNDKIAPIIDQEKINELISDIKFIYDNLRKVSFNISKGKS